MNERTMLLDIHERPKKIGQWLILSFQHIFAMFGATVLVPILTGLDVGVALVTSGLGTLVYIALTRGKVPVYLGSSFAYITTISAAIASTGGMSSAFVGLMIVGLIYVLVAIIIYFLGSGWLTKLLPPVVVGPMIIIIGMSLAPVAIGYSGLTSGQSWEGPVIAFVTFLTVILLAIRAKGFLKVIPFIIGIFVGYIFSVILGVIDLKTVFANVPFFSVPDFHFIGTYKLNFSQILVFAPLAFVTIAEHIGDHVVLGEITNRDFIKDPGIHRTLLGDGIATLLAGAIGGPANTTYGENTGVVGVTKVASVYVIGLAAIIAILLGFLGYIQAFIMSIPEPVIGGMTIILYGFIATNGVKVLIKDRTDLSEMKNLIVVSAMLVIGLGGASIQITGDTSLQGMALAVIVGIILNQVLNLIQTEKTKA